MIEQIKNTIQKQLKKINLSKEVYAAYVCEKAKPVAQRFNFEVLSYKNNKIRILVDNGLMAYEIRASEEKILNLINKEISGEKIKKIIYQTK